MMYTIKENGKVIHCSNNLESIKRWAFVLVNTQGRKVIIEEQA